jgi:hypothetical protein
VETNLPTNGDNSLTDPNICEGADEFKHLSDFSILSSDYVIHPSNLTMFAVQMQFFPHSAVMYLETQHGFS